MLPAAICLLLFLLVGHSCHSCIRSVVIVVVIIIIVKSSAKRDNNYCHYVIPRKAGSAITLYYHPVMFVVFYLNRQFSYYDMRLNSDS
jgi:hypothetical protein